MVSGLAGTAMLISGCSTVGLESEKKAASTGTVNDAAEQIREESNHIGGYTLTATGHEEIPFTRVSDVSGRFWFDQDVLSPADNIFNIYGTALTGVCAKPAFAVSAGEDSADVMNFYINVHGNMTQSYSVRLSDLKEKEQTRVMACACATGDIVVNASVTGVALADILELAELEKGVNTVKAVGVDGFGIPMPLSYALDREAMLVYRINGQPLPENQRTQLWMPGTAAKYFTRNIVDIEVTRESEVPQVVTPDVDYRAQVAIMNYMEEDTLAVGEEILFEGYADDFDKAVTAVQFSMDDGETWTTCDTEGATADKWVYWYFAYTPQTEGIFKLTVRAVTEDGTVSPLASSLVFQVGEAPEIH